MTRCARRYLIPVSDQSEQPLDESDEIAYLRSTPVETLLANHFFVLLQLAALQLSRPEESDSVNTSRSIATRWLRCNSSTCELRLPRANDDLTPRARR
jgi:hypothetical protein